MKQKLSLSGSRRRLLQLFAATGMSTLLPVLGQAGLQNTLLRKAIPSSGEKIPLIGLGSWITFNVGDDSELRNRRARVMAEFFAAGGAMIDSSPMYGSAQQVIGYCYQKLGKPARLFAADKVWTSAADEGAAQLENSRRLWGVKSFDLMQVHNLVAWREHLPMLQALKKAGQLRYVGVTTSHGRRHRELEKIMLTQQLDFVQLTYNMRDREAEKRLLPLAGEKGIAVIANRPFQRGELIDWAKQQVLPKWAADIDCHNWAQFLLKFIVSHPAVTCAIPATTRLDHLQENMGAASGRLPDAAMRKRMLQYVEQL